MKNARPAGQSPSAGGKPQMARPVSNLRSELAKKALEEVKDPSIVPPIVPPKPNRANKPKSPPASEKPASEKPAPTKKNKLPTGPILAPTTAPPTKPIVEDDEATKQAKKRINIIKEIISTEASYCEMLEVIMNLYYTPLMNLATKNKDRAILSESEILGVFSNIDVILQINTNFLNSLKEKVAEAVPDERNALVGGVFKKLGPFFKMYTQYINNHPAAVSLLVNTLYKRDKFKNLMHQNERIASAKGLDLESLLITPVQRVPRYKLLLEVLIKCTDEDHPDYADIQEALGLIGGVASQINRAMQESQDRENMLNIQKQFKEIDLITPSRKFVMKGVLTKKCRSTNKDFTFFLFNDLMLYAHGGGLTQYVLHHQIDINSAFSVKDLPDSPEAKNGFEIRNTKKSFVVYAPDPVVKQMWLKALEDCVEQAKRKRNGLTDEEQAPLWDPDGTSKNCVICLEPWNALLRRRHHCRRCGILVCADCSKGKTSKGDRICDRCVREQTWNQSKLGVSSGDLLKGSTVFDNESIATTTLNGGSSMTSDDKKTDEEEEEEEQDIDDIAFEVPPPVARVEGSLHFVASQTHRGNRALGELDMAQGDELDIQYSNQDELGQVWWYARNLASYKTGWVNPTLVEERFHNPDDDIPTLNSSELVGVYRTIAPYSGSKDDETLGFEIGDVIDVILTHESGYWFGANRSTGETGWCDPAFLEEVVYLQ
jgi:hypothetical protein